MQHTEAEYRAMARELVLEQVERLMDNNFFLQVLEDDYAHLSYTDICSVLEELGGARVTVNW